jgi:hypothetical protein
LLTVDVLACGTATDRLLGKSLGRQETLNFIAELHEVLLLHQRLRLPSAARLEAAQLQPGAEPFRELGRVEHRVEERQQAILQRAGLVEPARGGQIVELLRDLGHNAARRVGAAVATNQQHWH